jgi:hypothetical protein
LPSNMEGGGMRPKAEACRITCYGLQSSLTKNFRRILNLIWGFAQGLDADFSHKIFINVSDPQ